ncbi:GNAT family N-acetyltransferase [Salinibaculum salinum]|uniref:GNAT family N-acetyltransferase n=1 Tax=Salinibaculum salinum TaxID=3131996 RepID=UPI0030EB428B
MTEYELRRVDGDATLTDAHAVRRAVFIVEQGVAEDIEMDDKDDDSTHFVAFDPTHDRPVGTTRLRAVDGETVKIERVAVLPDHRSEGLGLRLMERAEDEARAQGYARVRLHAQSDVEEFYERLGYRTVSEEFEEAGIPHVEMTKDL